MATALVSMRLSPRLAAALDYVVRRYRCTPGELIEELLFDEENTVARADLLAVEAPGPFTAKRTFRISPRALSRLKELTGRDLDESEALRRLLAHGFSQAGILSARPEAGLGEVSWPAGAAARAAAPLWETGGWIGKLVAILFVLLIALMPLFAMWLDGGQQRLGPASRQEPRPEDRDGPIDSSSRTG